MPGTPGFGYAAAAVLDGGGAPGTPTEQEYEGGVADLRHTADVFAWLTTEPQRTQLADDDLHRSQKSRLLAEILREALHHV